MNCSLCGYSFNEEEIVKGCGGCPFFKGCDMIRCPNCGFETPKEAKLVKVLKKWRDKDGSK